MTQALNLSQFTIPADQAESARKILTSSSNLVGQSSGLISSTVWQNVPNQTEFARLTFFESVADIHSFYDQIQGSDELVTAIQEYGISPDVSKASVDWAHHFQPAKLMEHPFVSVSERALDPGRGKDWVEKLKNNFEEISILPGYRGSAICTDIETPEIVIGLAFWDDEESYVSSIPSNPSYPIRFFALYQ